MVPKIREMKDNDPCPCGSGKTWKGCCGMLLKQRGGATAMVQIAPGEKVRFFLCEMLSDEAFVDMDGKIPVFTNRAQALALNERLGHAYQVCGMTQDTWEKFQKDIPNHKVMPDAVA